jgi:hypothetical protein
MEDFIRIYGWDRGRALAGRDEVGGGMLEEERLGEVRGCNG